ncbi:SO_0444 family Cu/Zn efflux transporter [Pseudoalteromonas sp. SSM20]|uniref:SO_0444 family Cu/Zn efflux transporter n=1 Tax=Pseudoalteromonas sp. SSM20 TaxID=3139394 RepID=UPI003BA993BB
MTLVNNFIELFIISAPWLLLGLFIAALINVYLPTNFLNRHLGKEGFATTIKAALIGAPMPLCSCGVIPAALGLRRAGASKSATTAFLVSTPETGVDSISVSYVLLGPFMAVIRPIAAVTSAITAGLLVGGEKAKAIIEKSSPTDEQAPSVANSEQVKTSCCSKKTVSTDINESVAEAKATTSCCATKPAVIKEVSTCCDRVNKAAEDEIKTQTSCCASNEKPTKQVTESSCCASKKQATESSVQKLKRAFAFSANKLLSDTAKWLMIGLFFAALVQTYVPQDYLQQYGSGIWAMLIVILISIPMYVCATASTPIAAGLLMSGVSPGAALVFMLAGPATNVATLGVVASELGKRAVAAYLSGVIGVALVFGFITDYLVERYGFEIAPSLQASHHVLPMWLEYFAGIVLALLLLRLVWLKVIKK